MKKLIIASIFMFLSFNVAANNSETMEFCTAMSGLGESIMTARQNNADIGDMFALAQRFTETSDLAVAMVTEAFNRPRFSTESNKQASIRDFKNEMFLVCLEARK